MSKVADDNDIVVEQTGRKETEKNGKKESVQTKPEAAPTNGITEEVAAPATVPKEETLPELAEKIYGSAETAWKELIRLQFVVDRPEEREKFRDLMHEKTFGKFVSVFKHQTLLYVRVGDYAMNADYHPKHYHIEKIVNFLGGQKENWLSAAQEILAGLAAIPAYGRMARGRILYPEIEIMEKEIDALKALIKDKNLQLRYSLDTWAYLAHEIHSALMRGTPRINAMLAEMTRKGKKEKD